MPDKRGRKHKGLFGYGRFEAWDRKKNPLGYEKPLPPKPVRLPTIIPFRDHPIPEVALKKVTPEMQVPQSVYVSWGKDWRIWEVMEYLDKDIIDRFRKRVLNGEDLIDIGGTEDFPDFSILRQWVMTVPVLRDVWHLAERQRGLFGDKKPGEVLEQASTDALRPPDIRMTPELEDYILGKVSDGQTLLSVCRHPDMPTMAQVNRWALKNPDFANRLEEARKLMAASHADETIDIADSVIDGDLYEEVVTPEGDTKQELKSKASDRIKLASLRIQVRRDMARWYDRDRFGDQVAVNKKITVDIGARMVAAQKRIESAITGEIIEGEAEEIGENRKTSSL